MLRITIHNETPTTRLVVEGSLAGPWVEELAKSWLDVKAGHCRGPISLDLSGVGFIDDEGRRLLKRVFCEGAELQATGVMTKGIIEEIVAEASSNGDAVDRTTEQSAEIE